MRQGLHHRTWCECRTRSPGTDRSCTLRARREPEAKMVRGNRSSSVSNCMTARRQDCSSRRAKSSPATVRPERFSPQRSNRSIFLIRFSGRECLIGCRASWRLVFCAKQPSLNSSHFHKDRARALGNEFLRSFGSPNV